MKKLMLYIVFCSITFNISVLAQENDTVDLKSIVQAQIERARAKQNQKSMMSVNTVKTISTKKVDKPEANFLDKVYYQAAKNNWLFSKIGTLFLLSIVLIVIILFRIKKINKLAKNLNFKQNIKKIREEHLIKKIDPRLKEIRTRLCLNSFYLNSSTIDISSVARKFQIAKGEILLASRIRSLQLNNNLSE